MLNSLLSRKLLFLFFTSVVSTFANGDALYDLSSGKLYLPYLQLTTSDTIVRNVAVPLSLNRSWGTPRLGGGANVIGALDYVEAEKVFSQVKEGSANTIYNQLTIKAPDIAENGAVVPLTATFDYFDPGPGEYFVFVENNEKPLAATLRYHKSVPTYKISTRLSFSQSSDVWIVYKSDDGYLYPAFKNVSISTPASPDQLFNTEYKPATYNPQNGRLYIPNLVLVPGPTVYRDVELHMRGDQSWRIVGASGALAESDGFGLKHRAKNGVSKVLLASPMTINDYVMTIDYTIDDEPLATARLSTFVAKNPFFSVEYPEGVQRIKLSVFGSGGKFEQDEIEVGN
jgi:sulfur-oxidizing protein SoxY